jgi:phage-related minor tail protein
MRLPYRIRLLFLAAIAASLFPSFSSAAVRIELKNGGTILADECRESDGKFLCYKMGGTFEIEKGDVASMKETSVRETGEEEETSPPAQPEEKEGAVEAHKGAPAGQPGAEARKRLEQITERKRALQPEREKLVREREDLQEEVSKAPDWMTVDRFNDLQKKIATLDERIKGFNDEVKQLNQEEKTILDSLKTTAPKTP